MAASNVSRWLSWRPIGNDSFHTTQGTKPTEPTKPPCERGFVGSVGFGSGVARENSRETADERRISWHEWEARRLNEIFETQGVTGKPSNITSEDVRRGEEARQVVLRAKCQPQNHWVKKHGC